MKNLGVNMNVLAQNRFGFDCLLFERCNMNCSFCLEDHSNSEIDLEWIRNMPQKLLERFKEEDLPDIHKITFRYWGGELFFDELPDSLFLEYRELINKVNELFNKEFPDIELSHSWVSNGVYKNIDRVIELLKDTGSQLSISYDPVGRYQKSWQESFALRNIAKFHSEGLLAEISITLTKPNIEAYISGKSCLRNLVFCKKFDINYYIPNKNWQELLPSDEDLFNFFKWVVDGRLFCIIDVSRVLRSILYPTANIEKVCNCDHHISACKGCLTYNCVTSSTVFPNKDFYGNKEITEKNVAKVKQQLGLMKRGCMFCKYSNICPKCCYTSILYKDYKVTECPFKKLYEYISDHQEILEDFKEWEKGMNVASLWGKRNNNEVI